ncbi:MAG TPA: hypothetical protein GX532_02625 [Clostridia bacterium]|jgi:hypothetical protein|nr:hypothetical protein [Clostridia bacterium]HHY05858.1 hypothetical protein [Clostridia bacterium]
MINSSGKYYFYKGLSKEEEIRYQPEEDKKEREQAEHEKERAERQPNEISFLGIKISYAKAFGIAFLIIFLLLFFPGIGVSSSAVKKKVEIESSEKGNLQEDSKTF